MVRQRLRRGLSEWASGTDSGDTRIGLDYVSLAAEQEGRILVRNEKQSFQVAQEFVGAPIFGEFDGGAPDVAVILLQFRLEAAEESKSVGRRAGKSGKDFVLIETANLLRPVLDNGLAQRNLAVSCHNNFVVATNAENSGGADQAALGTFVVDFVVRRDYFGHGYKRVLFHERNL